MTRSRLRNAFTLVEMLVVLVVLGIIAGMAIAKSQFWRNRMAMDAAKNDLGVVATKIEAGYASAGTYDTTTIKAGPWSQNVYYVASLGGTGTWALVVGHRDLNNTLCAIVSGRTRGYATTSCGSKTGLPIATTSASPGVGVATTYDASSAITKIVQNDTKLPNGALYARPALRHVTPLLIAWDFGDGVTMGGAAAGYTQVTHTFSMAVSNRKPVKVAIVGTNGMVNTGYIDPTTGTMNGTSTAPSTVPSASANDTPIAAAAVLPSSVNVNTTVSFSAANSWDGDDGIASYSWSFSDGATGSGVSVDRSFAAPGTYTGTVTVTDHGGLTSTASASVTVRAANRPPVAVITPMSHIIIRGNAATFDCSGSSDPDGVVSQCQWDFGDGTTATGTSISHTYAALGGYRARLTVVDNQGATSSDEVTLSVVNATAHAVAYVSPDTANTGTTVTFDGTGSTVTGTTISAWAWNFGDSQTGTGAIKTHVYTAPGIYTYKLVITTAVGTTDSTSNTVRVLNRAPVAGTISCSPSTSPSLASVTCTASGFSDPDGGTLSYSWNMDTGWIQTGASGNTVTGYWNISGVKTLSAVANDNQSSAPNGAQTVASPTISYTVTNLPPTPGTLACSPTDSSYTGTTVNCAASGWTDPDGGTPAYTISYGDGYSTGTITAAHSYATPGVRSITVTVTDGQGGSTPYSISYKALNRPPSISSFSCTPTNTSTGTPVACSGTASDPDGGSLSYQVKYFDAGWNTIDSSSVSGAFSFSEVFTSPGTYYATAYVKDNQGSAWVASGSNVTINVVPTNNTVFPTWDKAWNFRDNPTAVTDSTNETYEVGETYPTTRNGVTFGWTAALGDNIRTRTGPTDRRLVGLNRGNNPSTATFRVDLPAPGTYDIYMAGGDPWYSLTNSSVNFYDGNTLLFGTMASPPSTSDVDATSTVYTWANWSTSQKPVRITTTGTTLLVGLGRTNLSGASVISYLRVNRVGANGANQSPTVSSFTCNPTTVNALSSFTCSGTGADFEHDALQYNVSVYDSTWTLVRNSGTLGSFSYTTNAPYKGNFYAVGSVSQVAGGTGWTRGAVVPLTVLDSAITWSKAWNFRNTAGYVTDGAGETYVGSDGYPTSRNGTTFGWTVSNGITSLDQNAANDRRLAGVVAQPNNGTQSSFRVDLPQPGTYDINLAVGSASSAQTAQYVQILDDTIPADVVNAPSGTAQNYFLDANGNGYTAANWPTGNATYRVNMTGTKLRLKLGTPTSKTGSSTIAHLKVTRAGAVAGTNVPTTNSFSCLPVNVAVNEKTTCNGSASDVAGDALSYAVVYYDSTWTSVVQSGTLTQYQDARAFTTPGTYYAIGAAKSAQSGWIYSQPAKVLVTSLAPFDAKLNIRADSSFAVDGPGETWISDAGCNGRNGLTCWFSGYETTYDYQSANAHVGGLYDTDGSGANSFNMTLPSPGTYEVHVALPAWSWGSNPWIQIRDGSTILYTLDRYSPGIAGSDTTIDAAGTEFPTAAAWDAGEQGVLVHFNGTQFKMLIGKGAGYSNTKISYIRVRRVDTPGNQAPNATSFSCSPSTIVASASITCSGTASDPESDALNYVVNFYDAAWMPVLTSGTLGSFTYTTTALATPGNFFVIGGVTDSKSHGWTYAAPVPISVLGSNGRPYAPLTGGANGFFAGTNFAGSTTDAAIQAQYNAAFTSPAKAGAYGGVMHADTGDATYGVAAKFKGDGQLGAHNMPFPSMRLRWIEKYTGWSAGDYAGGGVGIFQIGDDGHGGLATNNSASSTSGYIDFVTVASGGYTGSCCAMDPIVTTSGYVENIIELLQQPDSSYVFNLYRSPATRTPGVTQPTLYQTLAMGKLNKPEWNNWRLGDALNMDTTTHSRSWALVEVDNALDANGVPIPVKNLGLAGAVAGNHAPTSPTVACSPNPVAIGATVTCTASGSTDADMGDPITYYWSNSGRTSAQTGTSATYVFSTAGTKNIQATASDGRGGDGPTVKSVTVTEQPPVISAFTCTPTSTNAGNIMSCSITSSNPSGGTLIYQVNTYTAAWGLVAQTNPTTVSTSSVSMPGPAGSYYAVSYVNDQLGSGWVTGPNVALTASTQLIFDGSFETPVITSGRNAYLGAAGPWSLTGTAGYINLGGNFGGGSVTKAQYPIDGQQAAFLQSPTASISQPITIPQTGTYSLSYYTAGSDCCLYGQSPGNTIIDVIFAGAVLRKDTTTTSSAYAQHTVSFVASAGTYTLNFQLDASTPGGTNLGLIDLVQLSGPTAYSNGNPTTPTVTCSPQYGQDQQVITCTASGSTDPHGATISYINWSPVGRTGAATGTSTTYQLATPMTDTISVIASNGTGGLTSGSTIVVGLNQNPTATGFSCATTTANVGSNISCTVTASDPDNGPMSYRVNTYNAAWALASSTTSTSATVVLPMPGPAGTYYAQGAVIDNQGSPWVTFGTSVTLTAKGPPGVLQWLKTNASIGFNHVYTLRNVQAGNTLVVLSSHSYAGCPVSISDSRNNTWTLTAMGHTAANDASMTYGSPAHNLYVGTAPTTTTGDVTVTITAACGQPDRTEFIAEFHRLDQTTPIDKITYGYDFTTTADSAGAVTTTQAGDLMVGIGYGSGSGNANGNDWTPTDGGTMVGRNILDNFWIWQAGAAGQYNITGTSTNPNSSYPAQLWGVAFKTVP